LRLHRGEDLVADRAVETLRMCSVERNTNGRTVTMVSGTTLFSGPVLMRIMSSAPIRSCSMLSFSVPSVPDG